MGRDGKRAGKRAEWGGYLDKSAAGPFFFLNRYLDLFVPRDLTSTWGFAILKFNENGQYTMFPQIMSRRNITNVLKSQPNYFHFRLLF